MRRILSLALASVLLLAGCAGSGGAPQNGEGRDTGGGKKAVPMSCTLSVPAGPNFLAVRVSLTERSLKK